MKISYTGNSCCASFWISVISASCWFIKTFFKDDIFLGENVLFEHIFILFQDRGSFGKLIRMEKSCSKDLGLSRDMLGQKSKWRISWTEKLRILTNLSLVAMETHRHEVDSYTDTSLCRCCVVMLLHLLLSTHAGEGYVSVAEHMLRM